MRLLALILLTLFVTVAATAVITRGITDRGIGPTLSERILASCKPGYLASDWHVAYGSDKLITVYCTSKKDGTQYTTAVAFDG